jgi:uncharacterized protein (TIGR00369 family)
MSDIPSSPAGVPLSPFAEWFGLTILRAEPEVAEVGLTVQAHHLNKFGNAHGGVCLSLSDHACGALLSAIAPDEFFATVTLTSAFFAPVSPGNLLATARLTARSRSLAHIEASVTQHGTLVFRASGSFAIRPRR